MTTDADAYQRLARALDAHRDDADAYRRLGAQMTARRHQLDARYGNRRLFVRERLVPLGLKENAAYKLAYDLERGELQGRGGFSAGSMIALADAYGITTDAIIAVLDGGELGTPPAPEPGGAEVIGFPARPSALVQELADARLADIVDELGSPVDMASSVERAIAGQRHKTPREIAAEIAAWRDMPANVPGSRGASGGR